MKIPKIKPASVSKFTRQLPSKIKERIESTPKGFYDSLKKFGERERNKFYRYLIVNYKSYITFELHNSPEDKYLQKTLEIVSYPSLFRLHLNKLIVRGTIVPGTKISKSELFHLLEYGRKDKGVPGRKVMMKLLRGFGSQYKKDFNKFMRKTR